MKRWLSIALFTLGVVILLWSAGNQSSAQDKKIPEVPPKQGKSEIIKLFNGKDLEGWEGYTDLWSVKDGVIVGKNDKPLKVSTYLFTKQKFSDFRLLLSFKLVGKSEMHSGVGIWGTKIDPAELEKIEVKQKLDAAKEHGEHTYRGHLVMFPSQWGLFDLYRRAGKINPPQAIRDVAIKAGKQRDWNDMEILAQGNRIRLVVNGKLALDWRDPEPKLVGEGPIALQLHSEKTPQELHFKGLEVTTFPEDKLLTVK